MKLLIPLTIYLTVLNALFLLDNRRLENKITKSKDKDSKILYEKLYEKDKLIRELNEENKRYKNFYTQYWDERNSGH